MMQQSELLKHEREVSGPRSLEMCCTQN